MKIGQLVKSQLPRVFEYCEIHHPSELERLCDRSWSKENFDLSFPFCKDITLIAEHETMRYWRDEYSVFGMRVRVTSQWFNPPIRKSRSLFLSYLEARGIQANGVLESRSEAAGQAAPIVRKPASKGRYRGNAVGNAQNLLVRNILSRLRDEAFNEADWQQQIEAFGDCCAYCGARDKLLMDHAVPINKQALGEHRIGNLVPSCHDCNAKKGAQNFHEFLSHDPDRIAAIEAHMKKHDYVPLGENEEVRQIVELAHQDVRQLADRYVTIINNALSRA